MFPMWIRYLKNRLQKLLIQGFGFYREADSLVKNIIHKGLTLLVLGALVIRYLKNRVQKLFVLRFEVL